MSALITIRNTEEISSTESFSVDLDTSDVSGYRLTDGGFTPRVAQRDDSNGETWTHVDEEMRIMVTAENGPDAARKISLLTKLIDLAHRNWLNKIENPILLQYTLSGSGRIYKCLLVGHPLGSEVLRLPVDYDSATSIEKVGSLSDPILLRFRRRGALLVDDFIPDNFVINSSFEIYAGGFTDWLSVGASVTITQDSDNVQFGNFSARIQKAAAGGGGVYQDVTVEDPFIDYEVSVWVRPVSGTVRLVAYDRGSFSNPVTATAVGTAWQQLTLTKTAGAIGLRVQCEVIDAGSEAYFDGVRVSQGAASEYAPMDSEIFTAESNVGEVPTTLVADFSVSGIESYNDPVKITLGDFIGAQSPSIPSGYILINQDTDFINIVEAEDGTVTTPGGGTFATSVPAANYLARGGEVRQLRPFSPGDYLLENDLTLHESVRRVGVFASVRQRSATTVTYTVTGRVFCVGANQETKTIIMPPTGVAGIPEIIFLGTVSLPRTPTLVELIITPSVIDADASDSFEVDYIVVTAVDEFNRIISVGEESEAVGVDRGIVLDHRVLSHSTPFVYTVNTSGDLNGYLSFWRGNAFVTMTGMKVCVTPLFTGPDNFRYADATNGAVDMQITAERLLTSLVPQ